ncbi:MAG: carbon-nitrogen hydrolase family protein [Cyclobacteriaceae bacterium]|nr:carbon-nitrogen hydrolase family protein [Cyclobacteriaceae bacterium]
MKICVAQTNPVKGDIQRNIENHKKLVAQAVEQKADLIVFPELSLTGYEPTLAKEVAITKEDNRLNDFQILSDANEITIGVGAPTKSDAGICISMILFQPGKPREIYSKKYLHTDEEPYFVSGDNFPCLTIKDTNIAFAICYEISIDKHVEQALKNGATIYLASVVKFESGIDKAIQRLAYIASTNNMTVLMSNCVGISDGQHCAGKTSVWNSNGELINQLNNTDEGILVY